MKVCLFCSFFTESSVPEYVLRYLSFLRPQVDRLIFLTNDDRPLDDGARHALDQVSVEVRLVRNEGLDFGMWQKGLADVDPRGVSALFLVNDSCVCFASLEPFFGWFESLDGEVAGMLRSAVHGVHLQSFFLAFKGAAIRDVVDYIGGLSLGGANYGQVVRLGELGLSRHLAQRGYALEPFISVPGVRDDQDPSTFFPYQLVGEGFPLIKRRILQYKAPGVSLRYLISRGLNPAPQAIIAFLLKEAALEDVWAGVFDKIVAASRHADRKKFHRRLWRYRIAKLVGLLRA